MSQITAQKVKELREITGAGMMDCKKALTENADMQAAINFLREKGLAAASKKAGRVASEGLVAIFVQGNKAGMAEVNCETDFVARGPDFKNLSENMAKQVVLGANDSMPTAETVAGDVLLKDSFFEGGESTVEDLITQKIATIGEKISFRRGIRFNEGDVYGEYIHGGGSIGALVELKAPGLDAGMRASVEALAKDLAMHVAAVAPLSLERADLDKDVVENERQVFKNQVLEQKKPEHIVDKIVNGKLEKYYAEVCLLEQKFVKDPDTTISKLIEAKSKEAGADVKLVRFARFKVGEGIEKKADDFADEVKRMVQ